MNSTSVTRLTKKWFTFDLFLILISENQMKKYRTTDQKLNYLITYKFENI